MKYSENLAVSLIGALVVAFGGVAPVAAGEVKITLPPEASTLKPGAGVDLASTNCLICHSPDYLSMQPPMPRKFWEAEVKKMREKYAAPIPEDAMVKLADYLTATYGVSAPGK